MVSLKQNGTTNIIKSRRSSAIISLQKNGLIFGKVNSKYKCKLDKSLYSEEGWNLLKRELLANTL